MNRNQATAEGKASPARTQEAADKAIRSAEEAKLLARQAEGRLRKASDDVRDAFKNSRHP